MGVEKNLIDNKFNKSSSLDLYRPPALRNHSFDATKRNVVYNTIEPFEAIPLKPSISSTNTSATGTVSTAATSVSCNNSPIRKKDTSDTSNVITTDTTTTSRHQNSVYTVQQLQCPIQHEQAELDEQQKLPLRQQQQARRERRPDRAVYIPRARRSQTTPPTTATTQIQQPPPPPLVSAQVLPAPTATATTTTAPASHTGKSLSQQLAITSDDTTAASVNQRPSSKADEVGKINSNSSNITNLTTKKKEKTNKETRERREQRVFKKSLSTQQSNNSKNNTKSNENNNTSNEFSSSPQTVIVIAQETTQPLDVLSTIHVNSIDHTENLNLNPKEEVYDCDREREQIVNVLEYSEQNYKESCVIANFLNLKQSNDNCDINEFKTQLMCEPIDTVSINFSDTNNIVTTTTTITMPKSSNKATSNKTSSAMDNSNTKLPNLRIEDVASQQPTKCDIEEQELQRASKEINRSNRRIIKQTFVSDVLQIPDHIDEDISEPKSKSAQTATKNLATTTAQRLVVDSNTEEEEDGDDWESMYDDSGECLDPKIIQELTASVGKCKIELPKMDYSAYLTKQSILNDEEFPHVLEVSNFPVEFRNQDLLMIFSQYKESGFDIKWVDDTHALAVFSSSRIAAEVLTMGHPFVVLKPLAEATVESRLKAKKCSASLQPYRPRPETCAALARRLVTGALGVRLKTAAAERENEKRVLREAKERKLLAAKQREETWES